MSASTAGRTRRGRSCWNPPPRISPCTTSPPSRTRWPRRTHGCSGSCTSLRPGGGPCQRLRGPRSRPRAHLMGTALPPRGRRRIRLQPHRPACRRGLPRAAAGGPLPPARFQTLGEALDEAAHYRSSAEYAAGRAYWLDRFADRPAPLELTDGSRTALNQANGTAPAAHEVRRMAFTLPADRHRALRAAAREAGTNFPRALIATVAAYTARMTGREDIVVGLASRSRATPGAERFPGMMSDVLPLRLRITAATTWAGLLADTHEAVAQAVAHQRYRGEDLRRELGWPERRRVAGPLVNLIPPLGTIDLGGASGTLHNLSIMPTEDLTLCCFQHTGNTGNTGNTGSTGGGELRLTLDAHPDRCDDAALADHHERLATLLDALGPDTVHRPWRASSAPAPASAAGSSTCGTRPLGRSPRHPWASCSGGRPPVPRTRWPWPTAIRS
ncbi:condensation domain-containing protein [Streptomyces sp. FXJ1.4098]|nr:condensation domain-containing protein [Streptomyces sp. FXJ1.4098]